MNVNELSKLVKRVKNGTATPEEKELLERYWNEALEDNSGLENISLLERGTIKNEIYQSISDQLGFEKRQQANRSPFLLYKIAACVTVLLVATFIWYVQRVDIVPQTTVENSFVVIQTKFGEHLSVKLPDESSVVLNGNTKLRYSANWTSSNPREVWISGEGFFAIHHTQNHQKFIVHTQEGLNVEVLGTKFNVKSRGQGSEVLLTEGRVKLNLNSESKDTVTLQPGEMATVKEKKLSKRTVEGKKYTSWVRQKLFFDKMPLADLAQILKETYGVQVTFQNEDLKYRQLSGEISSATIDDILFAIAETFDIEVTRQSANSVTFSLKSELH
jgi:transmembrane sensor